MKKFSKISKLSLKEIEKCERTRDQLSAEILPHIWLKSVDRKWKISSGHSKMLNVKIYAVIWSHDLHKNTGDLKTAPKGKCECTECVNVVSNVELDVRIEDLDWTRIMADLQENSERLNYQKYVKLCAVKDDYAF